MASPEGKQYGLPVGQYVVSKLGGRWTPQKARFFDAWARAEGTAAAFNPFATTRRGFPSTQFNEVGVKNFPTLAIGQRATLETLTNGYYDHIVALLKDPQATAEDLAAAVANSPWGTGTGVLRVLGSKQATKYEQGKSRAVFAAQKQFVDAPLLEAQAQDIAERNVQIQALNQQASRLVEHANKLLAPSAAYMDILSRVGSGGQRVADQASRFQPLNAPQPVAEIPMPEQPTAQPFTPSQSTAPKQYSHKPGKPIMLSRGWKHTSHAGGVTGGLGWQDKGIPGDITGPPGTEVGAPASGVVTKIGSAQEGGAGVYIEGEDGHEYWLGHLDPLVRVGDRVERDQIFARISGEHPRPHVHATRRRLR